MISLRPVTLDDSGRVAQEEFALVKPWWEARAVIAPLREMLPSYGAIALDDGRPIGCAFMYLDGTGSGVAWLAWLATAPGTAAKRAVTAMTRLVDFLSNLARNMNYWLVVSTYQNPALVRFCNRLGFVSGDTGLTHLFKPL